MNKYEKILLSCAAFDEMIKRAVRRTLSTPVSPRPSFRAPRSSPPSIPVLDPPTIRTPSSRAPTTTLDGGPPTVVDSRPPMSSPVSSQSAATVVDSRPPISSSMSSPSLVPPASKVPPAAATALKTRLRSLLTSGLTGGKDLFSKNPKKAAAAVLLGGVALIYYALKGKSPSTDNEEMKEVIDIAIKNNLSELPKPAELFNKLNDINSFFQEKAAKNTKIAEKFGVYIEKTSDIINDLNSLSNIQLDVNNTQSVVNFIKESKRMEPKLGEYLAISKLTQDKIVMPELNQEIGEVNSMLEQYQVLFSQVKNIS